MVVRRITSHAPLAAGLKQTGHKVSTVTDPAPFLATIAGVSATMVAIIGGLLVARFVTLDGEQQGAQQLLDGAAGRLAIAQKRADEARQRLWRWQIDDFFDGEVLERAVHGERDVRELRMLGSYTPLSDDDLARVIEVAADEFARARRTLLELRVADEDAPGGDWADFKRLWPGAIDDVTWDAVWEIAYDELLAKRQGSSRPEFPRHDYPLPPVVPDGRNHPDVVRMRIEHEESLRIDVERKQQHAEDVQAEVDQLSRVREAIVRPKGLVGGLVVLGVFTLVGVVYPLWRMSQRPKVLTKGLGESAFWMFLAGLTLLLAYMTYLATRLSSGRRRMVSVPSVEATSTSEAGQDRNHSPGRTWLHSLFKHSRAEVSTADVPSELGVELGPPGPGHF